MAVSLYQKKASLATIGQELKRVNDEIAEKAGDPAVGDDTLNQLSQKADSLEQRFNLLNGQVESEEKAAKQKMATNANANKISRDPKQKVIDATAELVRSTMANKAVSQDVLQVLGDDDSTKTGGQNI